MWADGSNPSRQSTARAESLRARSPPFIHLAWANLCAPAAEQLVRVWLALLGFIGARYGQQILTGNKLLELTNFIGLLFELRSGPLSGLQYYYDVLPPTTYQETSVTDVSVDSSISWTRHVLGYTFRFPFPWLIDRVTLTPKLGLWSLEAKIPGPRDDVGRVSELREFEIENAISLGIEAGMELLASRFLLRPWAGIDSGYSPVDDSKRVTSRRVGLDTYLAGPRLGILGSTGRFAFLGFLFVENVTLTSDNAVGTEAEANEDGVKLTTARRIEYNAGYAGLGLALSW